MKIFMLIKWLHNSGAPKMFMWLANVLANQEHEVMVCTYQNQYAGNLSPSIKHIDYTNEQLGFCGKIKRIRQIIRDFDADVSISFLLDANVYNTFACYGLRTKSVICERNDPFKPGYYKLKFWKPWFRLSDGAVFQLPKVAEYYSNIKGHTAVIPNPIIDKDNIDCLPIERRKKRIVTHGRLDIEQKRHDILIKAFAMFHKEFPDFTLSIYGKDNDKTRKNENALKSLIKELGVESSVRLEGESLMPKESIKDAMLWVLTSDFEGIPNSLIEAMSMGLPCISTDCSPGGARFLIHNGVNGYLVRKGDAFALYEKMRFLIENPQEAVRIGKEAMNIKHVYNEEHIISMWITYLKKMCGREN